MLFPNPVSEWLSVHSYKLFETANEISIYNVVGERVLTVLPKASGTGISNPELETRIDVSKLPAGTYFIGINSPKGKSKTRFVKQ